MAADFLLEIEGIKGESSDSKHKDTIEIESFSWGMSNGGSAAGGGGAGAGKVSMQDLHCTTKVNKACPVLAVHCASGKHIKKAVLYVRKGGGDQHDFYKVTLEDMVVSSYQTGGHDTAGAQVPTDQFSLNYSKIKFEYAAQKADGSLDSPGVFEWNLKTNAPK